MFFFLMVTMLEETIDMKKYPQPTDSNEEELIELAEGFFRDGNYGAAIYYAKFLVMMGQSGLAIAEEEFNKTRMLWPEYDKRAGDYGFYIELGEKIMDKSNEAMITALEEFSLNHGYSIPNDKNINVRLEEHSPHYMILQELEKAYGSIVLPETSLKGKKPTNQGIFVTYINLLPNAPLDIIFSSSL